MRRSGRTTRMCLKAAMEISTHPDEPIYIVAHTQHFAQACCVNIYLSLGQWTKAKYLCIPVGIYDLVRLTGVDAAKIFIDHFVFEVELTDKENRELHRLCERLVP